MPPCSEEIAIVDNNLYVLFESASSKYFEGTDGKGTSVAPIDKVLSGKKLPDGNMHHKVYEKEAGGLY